MIEGPGARERYHDLTMEALARRDSRRRAQVVHDYDPLEEQ